MKFSKLQATGNDFILIDAGKEEQDWASLARVVCRPHFGVGADGLIVVQDSQVADLRMRIFNPDGSEAEVCGNGLRCLTKYALEKKMVEKISSRAKQSQFCLAIETLSGVRKTKAYISRGKVRQVEVSMGIPRFLPDQIPVAIKQSSFLEGKGQGRGEAKYSQPLNYSLFVEGRKLNLSLLSLGNPHAVSFSSEPVADFPLARVGPKVETDPVFPQRTNFEVARVLSRNKVEARVWERGVGETLACGSGACAIAVAAQLLGYVEKQVDIMLPGGTLAVTWDGIGEVLLAGPVEEVFTGEWPT